MYDTNPPEVITKWDRLAITVRWRVAAGWIVVMILLLRYVVHPVVDVIGQFYGMPPLANLDPVSWEDVIAIVGLPIGGAYADRLKDD